MVLLKAALEVIDIIIQNIEKNRRDLRGKMSDVYGLSSEITLSRATTGTLVLKDGKGLGIKAGTYRS